MLPSHPPEHRDFPKAEARSHSNRPCPRSAAPAQEPREDLRDALHRRLHSFRKGRGCAASVCAATSVNATERRRQDWPVCLRTFGLRPQADASGGLSQVETRRKTMLQRHTDPLLGTRRGKSELQQKERLISRGRQNQADQTNWLNASHSRRAQTRPFTATHLRVETTHRRNRGSPRQRLPAGVSRLRPQSHRTAAVSQGECRKDIHGFLLRESSLRTGLRADGTRGRCPHVCAGSCP